MVYIPDSERFPHDLDHHIVFASQEEKDINLAQAKEALRMRQLDLARAQTDEERFRAEGAVRQAERHWERINNGAIVPQRSVKRREPKHEE